MKCPGCGLNNLGHVTHCVKCGAALAAPVADSRPFVSYPPRAGFFRGVWRRYYAFRRRRGKIHDEIVITVDTPEEKFQDRIHNRRRDGTFMGMLLSLPGMFGELARMVLTPAPGKKLSTFWLNLCPGLGFVCNRQYGRGLIFFLLWLGFLLPGLYYYGSYMGNLLMGGMFSVHFSALFDSYPYPFVRREIRSLGRTYAVLLMALLLFYGAVYQLSSRRIGFVTLTNNMFAPTFLREDMLLTLVRTQYNRGDHVRFRLDRYRALGRVGGRNYYFDPGIYLDRVIGLPGETVKIVDREIYVNGNKLGKEYGPLFPRNLYDMEIRLDDHSYLIINSLADFSVDITKKHCTVPLSSIEGRVFMIWQPMSRRRLVTSLPVDKGN